MATSSPEEESAVGDEVITAFSGARWVTALLLALAGLGHAPLIGEHLEEAPYMGVLFVLFMVTCLVVAVALAVKGSALWYAVAGALCVAAIFTYVATRLVPFPQLSDDVGAWLEPLGVLCISAELAVVVLTSLALGQQSLFAPGWSAQDARRQAGREPTRRAAL